MKPPILPIAVSLGDPAGVGPELLLKAWLARKEAGLSPFVVAGGQRVLDEAAKSLKLNVPVTALGSSSNIAQCLEAFDHGLPVIGAEGCGWMPGQPSETGAWLAWDSLKWATGLAREGLASAVVTGPVAKSRLAEIGFTFPGQTEFVAAACGVTAEDAVMMLAGPSLRTVPLTVHVALQAVPEMITSDLIIRRTRIVASALCRDFGMACPRIAVAALNPHAGEQGMMGHEDDAIIAPAVAALQAEGIAATGPHSADAMFAAHEREKYDVALCMYHDQALIPIKTLDFDQGVNITLGLPIIRTSPDHGTAFSIAGKGLARASAMIAAIRMAGECATRRARFG